MSNINKDSLDNQKIVMLTIEYQKSWTNKGFFYNLIKEQLNTNNVISNSIKLLNECRKAEIKVIHAPLILDKKDPFRYKKTPFLARLTNQLTANTWKSEFTEGIYEKVDLVAYGRSSLDATIDSDLLELLAKEKAEIVVIMGFTTNHCVKLTYLTLEKLGYRCIIASECTAALNGKIQQKVLNESQYLDNNGILKMIQSQT